jgi:hypothetical protein
MAKHVGPVTRPSDANPAGDGLNTIVAQSQDVLLAMLKDRFERVVDALVDARLATAGGQSTTRDVLFQLYDDGLLTKAEVRKRGNVSPEEFYDELGAFRRRCVPRDDVTRALTSLAFSTPDDPENDRFPFNVPVTLTEHEGAGFEQILEEGAPAWVRAIRERSGS